MELTQFNKNQKAVLMTLLYSDVFDFPLTIEELWRNLIAKEKIDKNTLETTLKSLDGVIKGKKGFYCMAEKENSIEERIERQKYAKTKLKIAKKVAKYLSYIPTIYFIGITGRLAHNDADDNDDIDMFFITKKNTMWTTRILILAILEFMNLRRKPNEIHAKNKICANLIIEEAALSWPYEKRDIYIAHEIINIQPVFIRNNMYYKFLSENNWISRFFSNIIVDQKMTTKKSAYYILTNTISLFIRLLLIEFILEKLQKIYMKKKVTNETILPNFLAFHPHDYRQEILENFTKKIKQYGLLTNF